MSFKISKLLMFLALPLLIIGGATQAQADGFKAAIVMPGVITDKSFNQSGYEGMMMAKDELGIEVAYSEKVPQPDQAEALADYARRGYNLVIGYGGEFQDAVDRISKRYPDTMFLVANGVTPSENVAVVGFDYNALGYVMGYVGGKMSESGVGSFIGGQQIQFSLQMEHGFNKGFMDARPDGKTLTAWTNDWDDIAKGKEAALTVISQGADMLFPTMDNAIVGSYQAAKEQGKYAFGVYYDTYPDWPDTVLQSAVMNWSRALVAMLTIAKDGKMEGKQYVIGFDVPDAANIGTYHPNVPEEVRAEVTQIIADIVAGKIDPSK